MTDPAVSPGWSIGVDVGGTKIAAAAVDVASGAVRHRRTLATHPERGVAAVSDDIVLLAEEIATELQGAGQRAHTVGIGIPELVDPEGRICSAHLFDWNTVSLIDRLDVIAPATIQSDVRAAALAEARLGAGRPFRLVAYVSIGTGISSTVVQDGVPRAGSRGGALVLSSAPLAVPCASGGDWNEFVLEEYASGPAITRRYRTASGRALGRAEDVLAAAAAGDDIAADVLDSAARALGSSVAWLVNVVDPDAVVIGGGLGLAPGRFRDAVTASIRGHIWNPAARDLPIVPGSLGPDAGLIGAAISAHEALPAIEQTFTPRTVAAIGERR